MDVIEKYKRWVRANSELLSAFETGLSGLTWLLPERFSDNERLLESIHTISNLFSLINEGIYDDSGEDVNLGLRLALSALRQVEVLVELFSIDYAKKGRLGTRYDLLVVTETLKMLLRISLYRMSQGRLFLDNGLTNENGTKGTGILGRETKAKRVLLAFSSFRTRDSNQNEGKSLCKRRQGQVQSYWWDKYSSSWDGALAQYNRTKTHLIDDFRVLDAIVNKSQIKASKFIELGEVSHIVRPLVYVSCLRVWGSRSWKPWLIDFALELGSTKMTHYAFKYSEKSALKSGQHKLVKNTSLSCVYAQQRLLWSKPEMDELTRRKLVFVYFLIRDPFFGYVTRPIIERWLQAIKGVPLLSWLSEKIAELLYGVQRYFTYVAS
eukprot:jgi/Picsp_1/3320/NSC_06159-R1_shrunken seed protein